PLYLLACLVLGGSAQGIWQNAALQLLGIAIIAWAIASRLDEPMAPSTKPLMLLGLAACVLVALQAVPLPASVWAGGARVQIADGYALLGRPTPALSVSVTPYGSLNSFLGVIPPVAMFLAIV